MSTIFPNSKGDNIPAGDKPTFLSNIGGATAAQGAKADTALQPTVATKTTPVDADTVELQDSAASGARKLLTFANLWLWIKSKLDTVLTIAGAKTWSGQQELTGQAATNGTSAMTRDLAIDMAVSEKWFIFRDDFLKDDGWFQLVSGTGSISPGDYGMGSYGLVQCITGTTSGSFAGHATAVNGAFSALSMKPWRWVGRVKVSSIASDQKAFIGFSNNANVLSPNPWSGNHSGFFFEPAVSPNWRFFSGAAYFDTGVAAVADTWIKFAMRSTSTDNEIYFSVNDGTETLATGATDYIAGPAHAISNTSTNSRTLFVDFVSFRGMPNR